MLRQLLASTYAAANAYFSAVISVTLSSAKVEKVVNAPQKPVPNARLARGPAPAPASPPIASDPRTLSVQIATGPMLRLLAAVCAPYRARAPPHAPAQTKPQSTSCGLRLGCSSGDIAPIDGDCGDGEGDGGWWGDGGERQNVKASSKVCVRDKKCYCNCDCRTHVTEHRLVYMADGHNCELTEPYPLSRCQAQHTQKPNNSSLRFNVDGFRSG